MKRLTILAAMLLSTALAAYANPSPQFRYTAPFPSVANQVPPYLVANTPPNSPILAVCVSPANAVPCTNYAQTYTGAGFTCPNGAQDTPDPNALTSACQPTGDAQGNIGFWALAGTYDYTVCISGTLSCFGPYTVTIGGSGGGGVGTVTSITTTSPITGCSSPCTATATVGLQSGVVTPGSFTNSNITIDTYGRVTAAANGSAGTSGGNPQLENGTPDETGNSFYTVASLTNYFNAHWELVFNTTTYVNYTVFCPSARTGDTIAVDVWSADSTAGHTASITYADGVINSGTMNIGSLTSASPQTFTTTSTANNRVTLTFTVQSTISAGSILVVKIGTTPTGTAPTANIQIYPHFV